MPSLYPSVEGRPTFGLQPRHKISSIVGTRVASHRRVAVGGGRRTVQYVRVHARRTGLFVRVWQKPRKVWSDIAPAHSSMPVGFEVLTEKSQC
jgi:hypothetical protein